MSSAWQERGYSGPAPTYPELPDDLVGMTCGAVTRAGTPCKQKVIYWNGRCKFHGGMATGPTTEAGKEQSRINGRKGGRPRKVGAVLSDVAVSDASGETEVIEHKVSVRVSALQADISSAAAAPAKQRGETEITEPVKTIVSEAFHGVVSGRVTGSEMSSDAHVLAAAAQQETILEKPKSWTLKEVKVQSRCERCAMFASNGACLAVAKGVIPSIPTGEACGAFSAF